MLFRAAKNIDDDCRQICIHDSANERDSQYLRDILCNRETSQDVHSITSIHLLSYPYMSNKDVLVHLKLFKPAHRYCACNTYALR